MNLNEFEEDIKPPIELSHSLNINETQLMIPGPTNIDARVRSACALPVISVMSPQFFQVLNIKSKQCTLLLFSMSSYELL